MSNFGEGSKLLNEFDLLENIFGHMLAEARKDVRLASKLFLFICNGRNLSGRERFLFNTSESACSVLENTERKIINLKLNWVEKTTIDIPERIWKHCGDRIGSIEIVNGRLEFESLWNILFYCKNLTSLVVEERQLTEDICPETAFPVWRLVPVQLTLTPTPFSIKSHKNSFSINVLKACSCANSKELYVRQYNETGGMHAEKIYDWSAGCEETDLRKSPVLKEIMALYSTDGKFDYVGGIFDDDFFEDIEYIGRQVCTFVLRFNDEDLSRISLAKLHDAQKPTQLKKLQHLTIYGGCPAARYILRNLELPSLKHLNIFHSTTGELEREELFLKKDILDVLSYILSKLPSLEVIHVENKEIWNEVKSSIDVSQFSNHIIPKLQILNASDFVCHEQLSECCKLPFIQHRITPMNYSLKKSFINEAAGAVDHDGSTNESTSSEPFFSGESSISSESSLPAVQ